MNKFTIAGGIVGVALVTLFGLSFVSSPAAAGEYDQFAQCIADSGATFYGAFWCGACNTQKDMFGASDEHLPYVECSNPNRSLNATCAQANISSFPTWEFPDGSRERGVMPMTELADRTGCTPATDTQLEAGSIPEEVEELSDETQSAGTTSADVAGESSGTSSPDEEDQEVGDVPTSTDAATSS